MLPQQIDREEAGERASGMNAAIPSVPNRNRLSEAIFRRLGEDIVAAVLAPGEPLHDTEIADQFGVSRTPVREALLRLERVGLVVIQPSRRTIVSAPSDAALHDARRWGGHLMAIAISEAQVRFTDLERAACADVAHAAAQVLSSPQQAATAHFALLHALSHAAGSAILEHEVSEREFALRRSFALSAGAGGVLASKEEEFLALATAIHEDDRRRCRELVERIHG